jgi:hypothetical protein
MANTKQTSTQKILACGLGGGLDIVNASLVYFAAKNEGINSMIGSTRTAGIHIEIEFYQHFRSQQN